MISVNPYIAGYALLVPGLATLTPAQAGGVYIAHADHLLGTSFDLKINADSYPAALKAESAILSEMDRLTNILSSYLPGSEFNRWLAAPRGEAVKISEELYSVLAQFDRWGKQTGGVLNAGFEGISQLWQKGANSGIIPSGSELKSAVASAARPHWELNEEHLTATRLTETPLRLHTFTKSYVLDRVADAAMVLPEVQGVVLNSGGDVLVRGEVSESVALANPLADAENDAPMGQLTINNRAVATSGNYRRGFQIGEQKYSHLIDPRTGWPTQEILSATVVHPDAVTAGALATAFTILTPNDSQNLALEHPESEYFILSRNGEIVRSNGWNEMMAPPSSSTTAPTNQTARMLFMAPMKDKLWTADQELLITMELSKFEGRSHRPFVAVWVEDQNHKPVRNLALWFNKPRWLNELRAFYSHRDAVDMPSITSATRSPGEYTIRWDGKNDAGEYVNQGKYTICIEAAREHGTYQLIRQEMDFNGKYKQQNLKGDVEIERASLDYRKTK